MLYGLQWRGSKTTVGDLPPLVLDRAEGVQGSIRYPFWHRSRDDAFLGLPRDIYHGTARVVLRASAFSLHTLFASSIPIAVMASENMPGDDRAYQIQVPCVVFFVATTFVVTVRLWARIKLRSWSGIGWDDGTILASWVCCHHIRMSAINA